jgi:hypothetical protein
VRGGQVGDVAGQAGIGEGAATLGVLLPALEAGQYCHYVAGQRDRLTFNGTIIEAGTDSYRLAHTRSKAGQPAGT